MKRGEEFTGLHRFRDPHRQHGGTVPAVDAHAISLLQHEPGRVRLRHIQGVAAALARAYRESDDLARIGGDDFAALTLGLDHATREGLVSRIRAEIAAVDVAGGIPVSASIGIASCPPCATLDDAVKLADERLYQEKTAAELARRTA